MVLHVYNTLTRQKEKFEPLQETKVGVYSCGPTVYYYAHIGNLRTYVFSDIIRRVLEYNGYDVRQVMNITDVGHLTDDADAGEDKMEKGARREGKTVWDIAQMYTDSFMKDMRALNILDPHVWCKATDHIQEQIEQVQAIEERGYAYKTSDGVYFDTAKLNDYGKLAQLNIEQLQAGARIEMGEKKNKTDFALWKFSPQDEKRAMEWESPWGVGFPGWHIECSAMSSKYLGKQFDIHTGGIDHIPVHHTNEIAQAETAFDIKSPERWVKYWMHGEFLIIGESDRMAKSGDNFITLKTLTDKGYTALAYRYFCLTAHYRQQLQFSWEALDSAQTSYERLRNIIEGLREAEEGEPSQQYLTRFQESIDDDLNMPQALAVLWDALRDKDLTDNDTLATVKQLDTVLGLNLLHEEIIDIPREIQELADERKQARQAKDWAKSDALREQLQKVGWQINDTKEGYKLKKI